MTGSAMADGGLLPMRTTGNWLSGQGIWRGSCVRRSVKKRLQLQVGPVGLEPTTRGLKEGAVSYAEANHDAPIRTAYGR